MAIEAAGPEVDHVVPHGGEINKSLASVIGDCQIGNKRHLVLIQWATIDLVHPCQDCLL